MNGIDFPRVGSVSFGDILDFLPERGVLSLHFLELRIEHRLNLELVLEIILILIELILTFLILVETTVVFPISLQLPGFLCLPFVVDNHVVPLPELRELVSIYPPCIR